MTAKLLTPTTQKSKILKMAHVTLTEQEWVQLLNCASLAPYAQVQPLIQKVSEQLMSQKKEEAD